MKFTIKPEEQQIELIKAMGSKNKVTAAAAQEAFAALMGPTLGYVIDEADNTQGIFKPFTYDEADQPSLPVELFLNVGEGHFSVWSQSVAGGLPTNNIYEPIDEIKMDTYRLDSAMSFLKSYAAKARLDVVGKSMERMAQEILLKLNRNSWTVLLGAVAGAQNQGKQSVIVSQEAANGKFSLDDINKLFTLMKRQNESFAGGTPAAQYGKITDLVISPELMEFIRSMAYNPINTRSAIGAGNLTGGLTNTNSATVAAPDAVRQSIWAGGSIQNLFGVNLIEMVELGVNQRFTNLFNQISNQAGYQYSKADGTGTVSFGAGNDLVIGLNLAADDFAFRAVEKNAETGDTFTMEVDDNFPQRSGKMGNYGSMRVGHIVTSTRPIVGMII